MSDDIVSVSLFVCVCGRAEAAENYCTSENNGLHICTDQFYKPLSYIDEVQNTTNSSADKRAIAPNNTARLTNIVALYREILCTLNKAAKPSNVTENVIVSTIE